MHLLSLSWQQGWELLGWTMCWYLALGTGVALVGAVLRLLLRRANPNLRYSVSLAVFALLAVLPLPIAYWLAPTLPVDTPASAPVIDLAKTPLHLPSVAQPQPANELKPLDPELLAAATPIEPKAVAAGQTAEVITAHRNDKPMWAAMVEHLPWVWMVGTPLTFLLLASGLIGSQRLRRQCALVTEGPLADALAGLSRSLRVSRSVRLAIHQRITSPLLIGIVRPMILLPPSALTGWSPEQIEMVLLHELAHVRRWDNLVNLLQRMIESLLFFHPCVWWVSSWLRAEREQCCDALVVARTAKPQAYAELLVALATPPSPLAGLALSHHPLAGRIRRILHLEEEKMLVTRSTFGFVALAIAALLGVLLWQPNNQIVAKEPKAEAKSAKEFTADRAEKQVEPKAAVKVSIVYQLGKDDRVSLKRWLELSTSKSGPEFQLWKDNTALVVAASKEQHAKIRDMLQHSSSNRYGISEKATPRTIVYETDGEGNRIARIVEPTVPDSQFAAGESYGRVDDDFGMSVAGAYGGGGEYGREPVPTSDPSSATIADSPFPTLEEQKAADFAYKLLGLELEKVNAEELQRIKEKKFSGGLRIANSVMEMEKDAGYQFIKGDILVGLHVWPTTSLTDIQTILQRPDLAELTPLKYYVLRKTPGGMGGGGFGGYGGEFGGADAKDTLVTGRLPVNFAPLQPGSDRYLGRSEPDFHPYTIGVGDSLKVIAANVLPDQPIADVYVVESMGTLALGPTYGRVKVAGLTLLEAEEKIKKQLLTILAEVSVQVTLVSSASSGTLQNYTAPRSEFPPLDYSAPQPISPAAPLAPTFNPIPDGVPPRQPGPPRGPSDPPLQPVEPRAISNYPQQENDPPRQPGSPRKPVDPPRSPWESQPVDPPATSFPQEQPIYEPGEPAKAQVTLLYDNKTFDEWRSLWKNELKTEKRIEAIRAMAAFASAGYGKEAAEALLDVAEQYDFYIFDGSTESKLKEKVLEILCTSNDYRIDAELWLPSLLERYRQDPEKVKWLAYQAVSRLRAPSESETRKQLLALARGEDENLRSAAVSALTWSQLDDPDVKALSEELLSSKDPEQARMGLWLLRRGDMGFGGGGLGGGGMGIHSDQPVFRSDAALLAALTHPSEEIRREARGNLQNLPDQVAVELIVKLKEKLTEAKTEQQTIALLRTLAALNKKQVLDIEDIIVSVAQESGSEEVRISAYVAILRSGAIKEKTEELFRSLLYPHDLPEDASEAQIKEHKRKHEAISERVGTEYNQLSTPASSNAFGEHAGGGFF